MKRQTLAYVGIAIACTAMLIERWILEMRAPWFVWIPILAILGWSLWQLREPYDRTTKVFDFNPKRGALFFFLGFLIFPLILGIDAIFGTDISMFEAVVFTIGGSVFIGIVGVFTEHVGV